MMNRLALSILLAQAVSADLAMEPRSTTANEPHHPCPLHRMMKEAQVSCERDVVELCSDNNFLLRGPPVLAPVVPNQMDMHSRGPISPLNIGTILDEMMDSAMHLASEESEPTLLSSPLVSEEESESEENAASTEEEEGDAVDLPYPKVASVKLMHNHAMTEEDKAVEAFDNMLVTLFTKVVAEERSSQSNSKSSDVAKTVSVEGEAENVEANIPEEEEDKKPEEFDASVWTKAVVEHGHEILGQQKNAETDNVDLNRRRLQDEPKREIRRRLAERLTEVPPDVLIFTEEGIILFVGLPPPRMQGFIAPNPTFIGLGPRTDMCLWDNFMTRSLSLACGSSLVNLHNTRSEMTEHHVAKGSITVVESQPWVEAYGLQLILVILLCVYYCCLQKAEETDPCVCCCCGMDSSQATSLEVDDACCTCCKGTGVCGPGCTSCCGDGANSGKPCDCCDGEDCDMCSGGATIHVYRSLPCKSFGDASTGTPIHIVRSLPCKTYGDAYTGIPIQIV